MRAACALAREVLDALTSSVAEGVSCAALDARCVALAVARGCYPSPLGYHGFPCAVCVSVNEVVCHGIPDQTVLRAGDVVNIDVTLYAPGGYHADVNATVGVGRVAPHAARLMRTARECLDAAIALCGPGVPYAAVGEIIHPHAVRNGCAVARGVTGHGIGRNIFHGLPRIYHHHPNHSRGVMQPGHIFTIEPILILSSARRTSRHDLDMPVKGENQSEGRGGGGGDAGGRVVTWPDGWTVASASGQISAAFEETLLVTDTGIEVLTAQGGSRVYDTAARRDAYFQQHSSKQK